MTYPTKYTRQYDFAGYQNSNPTRPLPGNQVNIDLDTVKRSITEIIDFIKTSIRSDGELANGSVGVNQLDATFKLGFSLPTTWEPGVDYTTDSTVFYQDAFYKANTAHTSTAGFDESKWDLIVDFGEQATAAAASAMAAAASELAASNSATASADSATSSADSATAASNSATAASGSATTATTQATAASDSANAADGSAMAAAASAVAASGFADDAATSATEAAASAASITIASQAEAEAGTENTKVMTPLRTAEAIAALAASDPTVADRTALKALDTSLVSFAVLAEAGREGIFVFKSGDYSTHIALDTNEGVYVKANAIAASSGAWVRLFNFIDYQSKWFGTTADYSTDNTSIINSIIAVANAQNTLSGPGTAGKQAPVRIHVEGGVKFASKNISWLPSAGWVFVYLHYFANSGTTPGVVSYGTNEHLILSVNSGYPNDATGGWVAEDLFAAPLHPAIGVIIQKNADNSVAAHSRGVQRIQPTATYSAKASVAMIRDENNMVFRIAHEHYATVDEYNGVLFFVNIRRFELVVTNGGVSAGWQSSSVPVVGDVVRDITTGGRYVVTGLATSVITTDWLSGEAAPGNTLMRERAIFKGSISGTTLTVSSVIQGTIAVGHTIVGMFANSGIPASVTITGGSGSTWTISTSLNIAETEIVSGYLSVNAIQGGGVADLSSTNVPLQFGLDGKMYQRDTLLARFRTTLGNGAGASAGTLSNAPAAGNPTKWIPINDNGTVRHIPAW